MHIISKNIKALRLERGWTQQEMADMLFVTRQTVSNWENGKALPDVETLLQIAEKLDIDVNELVYGKRQPDEKLKRDLLKTIFCLAILYIIQFIVNIINQKYFINNYRMSAFHFYYFTIDPLKLFFKGVLLIQFLKSCGIIKRTKGIKYIGIYKYFLVGLFFLFSICPFESYKIDFFSILFDLKIGKFANATYFSSADYALNLPVWMVSIRDFLTGIAFSGSKFYRPPYYLIFALLGLGYELAKPYKHENNLPYLPNINDIKNAVKDITSNPSVYIKKFTENCKESFKFITSKSLFVRNATLLLIVLFLLKMLTGRFTTLFRKRVYTGITLPLTVFTTGILVAILFKRIVTVYKTDGFRTRKMISALSLILLALSLIACVPEIAREIMILLDRYGIITVTGTYDITGWVLTPPLWFDRLNEFFVKMNTSSKILWWAVLGFVNEIAKPYHGKEKYNNTDK